MNLGSPLRESVAASASADRAPVFQLPGLPELSAPRALGHGVAVRVSSDLAIGGSLDARIAQTAGAAILRLTLLGPLLLRASDALEEPVGTATGLELALVEGVDLG